MKTKTQNTITSEFINEARLYGLDLELKSYAKKLIEFGISNEKIISYDESIELAYDILIRPLA